MKKSVLILLTIVLLALSMLQTPLAIFASTTLNTDEFRYLGNLQSASADQSGFFILEIKPELYSTMDISWRDLRIYNNAGLEIGYTPLFAKTLTPPTNAQQLEIINSGLLKDTDKYSFTIRGLNSDIEKIVIKLDKPEYLVKAEMYGSNDNLTWQLVGTQTLYGLSGNYNTVSLNTIVYSYLKFEFTMPLGENLKATSAHYLKKTPVKAPELVFPILQTETNKTTSITIDLGHANYNSRSIKLITPDNNFYRRASLESSNNNEQWQPVSSFYLYRGKDAADENIAIEYPLTKARYLKVTLQNGDNSPIKFVSSAVGTEAIRLLVKASTNDSPFLICWGSPLLKTAAYDVREILLQGKVNLDTLPVFQLDTYKENPQYKKPLPPLTERFPLLLPAALVVAVVVVALIQFKSFKQIEK